MGGIVCGQGRERKVFLQQLKDGLVAHREEQFARALVAKPLTYSPGRTLNSYDPLRLFAAVPQPDNRLRG